MAWRARNELFGLQGPELWFSLCVLELMRTGRRASSVIYGAELGGVKLSIEKFGVRRDHEGVVERKRFRQGQDEHHVR